MIKTKHNQLYALFFDTLFGVLFRKSFRKIYIKGNIAVADGPVLLIANHFSWWDGFIARRVNKKLFKKTFHVMMLEEELRKRPFLRKLGAFSIMKKSRSALQSLDYAANILKDPGNMLLLFPQGRFQSSHKYPVKFEKGWVRMLEYAPKNTRVVFMASLFDYFEHRQPTLSIYLRNAWPDHTALQSAGRQPDTKPEGPPATSAKAIESAYNEFLKEAIDKQDQQANSQQGDD